MPTEHRLYLISVSKLVFSEMVFSEMVFSEMV
jgi:hypothetical protein